MGFICLLIVSQLVTVSLSADCDVTDDISLTELQPSNCDSKLSGIPFPSAESIWTIYQYFAVNTQQTEGFDGITLYFELGPDAIGGASSCSWDAELILYDSQDNPLTTSQTMISGADLHSFISLSPTAFNFTFDAVIPTTVLDSQYLYFYFTISILSGVSTNCVPSLVFCYDQSNMKTLKSASGAETCLDDFKHPGEAFANVDITFVLITASATLDMTTTIVMDVTLDSYTTVDLLVGSMIMSQSVIEFDESFGLWIAIAILSSIGVILLVSGVSVARYTKSDNIVFASVLIFIVYSIDVFSDIFFCISIWTDHALVTGIANQQTFFILAVCSVVFIVLPMVKNFYDLIRFQRDTQHDPLHGDRYTAWLNSFGSTFLLFALISGSTFGTMKLLNSNLLGLRLFSMGLSTSHLRHYHSYRMMNVVLLENMPQVIIQIAFISTLTETVPPISILAAFTSILSIIVALVDYVSKKELTKQAVPSELFTFQITSNEINAKPSKYRNRQKKVIKGISKILVLDPAAILIEIVAIDEYSDEMGDGLIVHFLITTLKYTADKIHQNLRESLINGSMARNMSKAWELHVRDTPIISHLRFLKIESVDEESAEGIGTTNTTDDNLVPQAMTSLNPVASSSRSKLRKKIVVKASDSLRHIPLDNKDNNTRKDDVVDVEVVISPILEDEADLPATIDVENDKQHKT